VALYLFLLLYYYRIYCNVHFFLWVTRKMWRRTISPWTTIRWQTMWVK